uniref:Uncharacterized protein n=1 Tax=Arundo donax TaxID=35708 RepID=A0A0A9AWZ9_ARUDO
MKRKGIFLICWIY